MVVTGGSVINWSLNAISCDYLSILRKRCSVRHFSSVMVFLVNSMNDLIAMISNCSIFPAISLMTIRNLFELTSKITSKTDFLISLNSALTVLVCMCLCV